MSQSAGGPNGIKDNSYKNIAELTSDLLWEWNLETDILRKSAGMSGVFKPFITTKSQTGWWIKHVHPEDRNKVQTSLHKAIRSKIQMRWHAEYRLIFDTKRELWVSDTAYIHRNSKGKAVRLVGSLSDITKRILTEEMLKMRLIRELTIAELSKIALSDNDIFHLFQQSIEKLQAVLGIDTAKVLELLPDKKRMILRAGLGWQASVIPHKTIIEKDKHSQAAYALRSKKPVIIEDLRTETRVTGPNMLTQNHIISGMSVILCKNNASYGVLSVHTKKKRTFTKEDIDYLQSVANIISLAIQRNETDLQLRKSQSQFKALYDANIIGVIYEKIDGEIIEANEAFLNMIGYSKEDFFRKKRDWKDITPQEYEKADEKAVREVKKTGIAYPYEKEYIKKDGSRVPAIVGAVMLNREEQEVLAFALDITERKELEMKKDEFMSIASHELRTPLTSIKGYTQILERIIQQMGDHKLETYLKKTNTYVERLNSLIVELLDVSKIQAGKLIMNYESVDFDRFVKQSIESVQHYSSRHSITYHGGVDEKLSIDRNRLEQVFTNLITNAIKYSPNADKIEIHVRKEHDSIIVSVKDEGIGISKKDQEKLFTRFYRVESSSNNISGLGIGLYISREIINRHGGDIWVTSKKGQGSVFTFSLPIKDSDSETYLGSRQLN